MDKLSILIVAPNTSSALGGEAFLPFKYFQLLRARGVDVRLVTHSRNRGNLQAAFPDHQQLIHYIEDTALLRTIARSGRKVPEPVRSIVFGTALNFVYENMQSRMIRRVLAESSVDVIHQPIPVSPRIPSSLYGFGIPVVIGPMNGGMSYPEGYDEFVSARARGFISVTRLLAIALNRLIPGKRRAAALLVANERTRAALPVSHPNVIELVENGVDLSIWTSAPEHHRPRLPSDPFRLVYLGRLVGWKAVDITLKAVFLARQSGRDVRLDIIGNGIERAALEALTQSLSLETSVRFWGFQTQNACASILGESDALILNSLYECGGAVVLEAMSLGLPVIASDWGGPVDYLDKRCGILVAPVPRESFAQRLADAIVHLADDPERASAMGEAGRTKAVTQFDWDKKVDKILSIYNSLMSSV
ncbi:glycosyltransferase involved in cell wall bisynthesis [Rhodobacter maris]|uniref:Glycosyltransferase involved in cell wall bisynthesis n=2 Tax=Rhodobacter maris TaxID=446682 RepID=A0A285TDF0_9RHOB|nr:glycosyltransferase involved in cell wall bisynthesis [Rhodobacter maris]